VARRLRLNDPGVAWAACAGVLAGGALLAWWWPAVVLDWQPALAFDQPWRWWTAAWVHWSLQHLLANLAAAVMVAGFGIAGRLPSSAALAWFAAWPLTHGLLLLQPALAHYGGLSGVLHAGVAVAVVHLLARGDRRQRWVGGSVLAGLLLKLALEAPWGAPLRRSAEWDIALAPIGHATGALAGLVCGVLLLLLDRGASGHAKVLA
jgi:rhomboid family GlyGly-CTERM serine protease